MSAASGVISAADGPALDHAKDGPGASAVEFPNHRVSVLVANIVRNLDALTDTITAAGPRLAERATRRELIAILIAHARMRAALDQHCPAPSMRPIDWPPVIRGRLDEALDVHTEFHAVPNLGGPL